jgi:hypothetical protein
MTNKIESTAYKNPKYIERSDEIEAMKRFYQQRKSGTTFTKTTPLKKNEHH